MRELRLWSQDLFALTTQQTKGSFLQSSNCFHFFYVTLETWSKEITANIKSAFTDAKVQKALQYLHSLQNFFLAFSFIAHHHSSQVIEPECDNL